MRAQSLAAAAAIAGGLAAGPGYYFYCTALSGQVAAEHELRAARDAVAPVTLHLAPDMNPVSLVASAWVAGTPPAETAFRLTIEDRGAMLYTDLARFTIEKDQDSGTRQARVLDRFEVPREDDYVVRFAAGNHATARLEKPALAVRRNIRPPDMTIVGWGFFFLALGAAAAWLGRRPAVKP